MDTLFLDKETDFNEKDDLPKIIWITWFQGLEAAPDIVKICYESWVKYNPGWRVIFLDQNNIDSYFQIESVIGQGRNDVTFQKASDILRVNLLARYGGVWADATCLCSGSLNTWIYEYTKSGFFAFCPMEKDRLISSWFIASRKDCPLTQSLCSRFNQYWKNNIFLYQNTKVGKFLVNQLPRIPKKTGYGSDFFISFFARKILKISPYFIFHYLFAYHVKHDSNSNEIFKAMPYSSSNTALQLTRLSRQNESIEIIRDVVSKAYPPVHKLTWKEPIFQREGLSAAEYIAKVIKEEPN
jgi:hypothetical protein